MGARENYPEYHIGYSDVTERFNDGSYIHYEYTSLANMPNSVDGLTNKIYYDLKSSSSTHKVLDKIGMYINKRSFAFQGETEEKSNLQFIWRTQPDRRVFL